MIAEYIFVGIMFSYDCKYVCHTTESGVSAKIVVVRPSGSQFKSIIKRRNENTLYYKNWI